jgi:hypothetical protein
MRPDAAVRDWLYFERWSRGYKEPLGALSEIEARRRHEEGKWYTVLVGTIENPTCFIEIVGENGYIGVNFLDDRLRDYLIYDFQRGADGLLFLSGVDHRKFLGETDGLTAVEQCRFKRDRQVIVTLTSFENNTCDTGAKEADVTANYEGWPEFGEYARLIVRERAIAKEARPFHG